ncbi:MAG: DUF2378 family protein, partial [Archangium sp.]
PRFMSTGLLAADVSLDWNGNKAAPVTMANVPHPSGHLLAGVVAVSLDRIGAKGVKLVGAPFGADGSRLELSWD